METAALEAAHIVINELVDEFQLYLTGTAENNCSIGCSHCSLRRGGQDG